MLVSPFTFYRGAALPMASDLATTPVSGLTVQACGDAHLSNFGVFGSPERNLVFDVNDFDETLPGPWEWDVKRLAASMEVAARSNGFSRQAAPHDRRRAPWPLPEGHARLRRDVAPWTSGTRTPTSTSCAPLHKSKLDARQRKRVDEGRGQGPHQGQHAGAGQAHPTVDGAAADHR